jgi:hypothetical protein
VHESQAAVEATVLVKSQILIGGEWVDSAGTGAITVVNPATEEQIARVPDGTPEDVDRAVAAAVAAGPEWAASTLEQRKAVLGRLARLIESRADQVTRMIVSEVSQPLGSAMSIQTQAASSRSPDDEPMIPGATERQGPGSAPERREIHQQQGTSLPTSSVLITEEKVT